MTFVDLESAERALKEMDRASFQGRLLHVMPAVTRVRKEDADAQSTLGGGKTTLKKERATKRKEVAAREFNWGMLYMNVSWSSLASCYVRTNLIAAE